MLRDVHKSEMTYGTHIRGSTDHTANAFLREEDYDQTPGEPSLTLFILHS
jgi:hypothetical protein